MKSKMQKTVRKARCPKCGHVWETRVQYPKACPECKVRLGWYRKRHGMKEA